MARGSDCSDSEPPLEAAQPLVKRHVCHHKDCGAEFLRPGRLLAHQQAHHQGKRLFRCSVEGCGKAYTSNSHLKRHVSKSHEEQAYAPVFMCTEPGCHRHLCSEWNLRRHHHQVHGKPFKCDTCGAGFSKHKKLSEHAAQHTGINLFKCHACELSFPANYLLKRHARSHKTYACTQPGCDSSFSKWTHLRKHCKLEHPRQYKCAECSKIFTKKSNVRKHVESHLFPLERAVFQCPYEACPRFYFVKSSLVHHVKSSHEGRRVACNHPGCERTFCTKRKMEDHKKLHDPGARLPRRRCKSRRKRKDAGQPKRSVATKLSGARLPYHMEKRILSRAGTLVEQLATEDAESAVGTWEARCSPSQCVEELMEDDEHIHLGNDCTIPESEPITAHNQASIDKQGTDSVCAEARCAEENSAFISGSQLHCASLHVQNTANLNFLASRISLQGLMLRRNTYANSSLQGSVASAILPRPLHGTEVRNHDDPHADDGICVPSTRNERRRSTDEGLELPSATNHRVTNRDVTTNWQTPQNSGTSPSVADPVEADVKDPAIADLCTFETIDDKADVTMVKRECIEEPVNCTSPSDSIGAPTVGVSETTGIIAHKGTGVSDLEVGASPGEQAEDRDAAKLCKSDAAREQLSDGCEGGRPLCVKCSGQLRVPRKRRCNMAGCKEKLHIPRLFSFINTHQWLSAMLLAMRLAIPKVEEPTQHQAS